MADDVQQRLAELERLHAAAANGSLRVGQHYGIHLYAGETPVGTTLRAVDAALVVAAVNALPGLVAAVRGVLDLHQPDEDGTCAVCFTGYQDGTCDTSRAIAAALAAGRPDEEGDEG